ncbi:integumentary mucin C.1-like [Paramacrobiotus metropolitanus]|uniref:integumentary mucin C.1-like n=1 Tax=Paramacrobiotus metropolitanus TaxID=2943436 RepID=UPI002446242B|nr:integumentary mucin C.1-like [Paramacrobiotus metropolitanus]
MDCFLMCFFILVSVLLIFTVQPTAAQNPCACGFAGYKSVCTESGITLSACSAKCYGLKVAYDGRCDTTFFWQAMKDKMDPNGPLLTPKANRERAKDNIWNNLWRLWTKTPGQAKPTPATTTIPTTPTTTTTTTTRRPTTRRKTTTTTTTTTTPAPVFVPLVTLNPLSGPRILVAAPERPARQSATLAAPATPSAGGGSSAQNQPGNAQDNTATTQPLTDADRTRLISGLSGQKLLDTLNVLLAKN